MKARHVKRGKRIPLEKVKQNPYLPQVTNAETKRAYDMGLDGWMQDARQLIEQEKLSVEFDDFKVFLLRFAEEAGYGGMRPRTGSEEEREKCTGLYLWTLEEIIGHEECLRKLLKVAEERPVIGNDDADKAFMRKSTTELKIFFDGVAEAAFLQFVEREGVRMSCAASSGSTSAKTK